MSAFILKYGTAIVVACVSFFGLHFVGRDILEFRKLRRDIKSTIDDTANVGPTDTIDDLLRTRTGDGTRTSPARQKLRTLSTQLGALYETTNIVVKLFFQISKYDVPKAAASLMGLSNSIHERLLNWQRLRHRYEVEEALNLPHEFRKEQIERLKETALSRKS